ncbi:MAG: GNAT family N-acetyltransferase [Candidatus Marithrix sp.]|nr:GNAT family N-acetyltransferase [Candidatus Marithrix sp.]
MIQATPIGLQSLQGSRVILERLAPEHATFLIQCYRNDEFMDLYRLAQSRNQTEQQIKQRLSKERAILPQQLKRIEWVIYHVGSNGEKQPIGLASLADYKPSHHRAEFLMGTLLPKFRGTKTIIEAMLLIMEFAFNQVKLNKLIAYTYGYNQYAQKNLIGCGFVQEGLLRQHINSRKGFLDLYINGLLVNEFRKNMRLKNFSQKLLGRNITDKPIPPQQLSAEYIMSKKADILKALS